MQEARFIISKTTHGLHIVQNLKPKEPVPSVISVGCTCKQTDADKHKAILEQAENTLAGKC